MKNQPWLPFDKIQALVQLEPFFVILGVSLGAWLAYQLFLKSLSPERHKNLRGLFKNLAFHIISFSLLFIIYLGLDYFFIQNPDPGVQRISAYIGAMVLLEGCAVFVKTWRILVFEYLFLSHMRVAVPLLLINLCTLLLAFTLGAWLLAEIFSIRIGPFLATSAIFTVVLGLALQDTLGNLFAGVAMQFDKPYQIGDWIEVQTGQQKWTGHVLEISWRATALMGLSDELMTIPNRVMGQSQISNFSFSKTGIARSLVFKFSHDSHVERIQSLLNQTISGHRLVLKSPAPHCIVTEANENWIQIKLVYFILDYGLQWQIADELWRRCLQTLRSEKIKFASTRLEVFNSSDHSIST